MICRCFHWMDALLSSPAPRAGLALPWLRALPKPARRSCSTAATPTPRMWRPRSCARGLRAEADAVRCHPAQCLAGGGGSDRQAARPPRYRDRQRRPHPSRAAHFVDRRGLGQHARGECDVVLFLAQSAAVAMRLQGHGRIIFTTSIASILGRASVHGYVAAKSALAGVTRSLAAELGEFGITCNAIAPGYFETDLTGRCWRTRASFRSSRDGPPWGAGASRANSCRPTASSLHRKPAPMSPASRSSSTAASPPRCSADDAVQMKAARIVQPVRPRGAGDRRVERAGPAFRRGAGRQTARRSRWWRGARTASPRVKAEHRRRRAAAPSPSRPTYSIAPPWCRAFDAAEKAFGTVTILVNNAGVAHAGRAIEMSEDEWRACSSHQSRRGVLLARRKPRGACSRRQAGRHRQHRLGAGLRRAKGTSPMPPPRPAWCRSTRRSASNSPSRAFASMPSRRAGSSPRSIATILRARPAQKLKRDIPVGRFGKDGDLDGALLLLASDAGSYIAGATIVVDGGQMVALTRVGMTHHGLHAFARNRGHPPAHARLRRGARAAARSRSGEFLRAREHPGRAARAGAREGEEGRPVGAAVAEGIWRHGAADRRLGGDVRGGRALDLRPARDQLHGARRRQHEPARRVPARRRRRKAGCARSSTARCARPSP